MKPQESVGEAAMRMTLSGDEREKEEEGRVEEQGGVGEEEVRRE